jgi:hypothetical protein
MDKPKNQVDGMTGQTKFLLFKLTSVKLTHRFRLMYRCTAGTDAASAALRNWHPQAQLPGLRSVYPRHWGSESDND